jgi:thioredoxin 1
MKKPIIVVTVIALLAVAGGAFYTLARKDGDDSKSRSTDVSMNQVAQPAATATTPANQTTVDQLATTSMENAATNNARYITLSEYNADKQAYSSNKKVYFFHASWCPICRAIEEDIESDESQIPEGTTFIEVDYDSSTALRQKYGVTYQYTFVQIDNEGNEQRQWSALNLDKAVAGIQ